MKPWKFLAWFGIYLSLCPPSFGVIGYINQTFHPGFSLRATQLTAVPNVVSNHLVTATNGLTLFKMAYKGFEANNYLYGWDYPDMPLEPGEAWFIKNPTESDIHETIVGEVADGTNSLPAGFFACSSIFPQAGLLQTDLLFPAQEGDQVYLFDESNQVYSAPCAYSLGAWTPSQPNVGVAQSFWGRKDSSADWIREADIDGSDLPSFHVTQPPLAWTVAQLNFFTYNVDPLYGRVYGRDGVTPLGSGYAAQVYAGTEPHDDSAYVPLGSSVLFPDGARAGYGSANSIEVPFLPGGNEGVYVQLRAWDVMRGATYEAAAASGALCGKSIAFKLTAHAILEDGHPGIPPPDVNLFPSFRLGSIPVITSIDRGPGAAMVWGRGIGTSSYVLEGATNMIFPVWTTQDVWTSGSDGSVLLLDYDASNHPVRFYRMSEP